MQHTLHIVHGLGPASVTQQIGGNEAQPVAIGHPGIREGGARRSLAGHGSQSGADAMPLRQKLENTMPGDEARAAVTRTWVMVGS
jgi:hypothetical protein